MVSTIKIESTYMRKGPLLDLDLDRDGIKAALFGPCSYNSL